jgi:hypothetical protein
VNNWRNLPAVFSDLTAKAFNSVVDGVEKLVNANIAGINAIIRAATGWTGAAAPQVGKLDLSGFKAGETSATEFVTKAVQEEIRQSISDARRGMNRLYTEIGAGALAHAQKDALEEAGKANRTPKGAAGRRDMSDERAAQFEAMLAQALADELQARLTVTRDVEARAKIEREILDQQERLKAAQVARQRANIEDDNGLSKAKRQELLGQLDLVAAANARAASLRRQAADEQRIEALARDLLAIRMAELDAQARVLGSARDLERSAAGRRAIDLDILKLRQQMERAELEQVVASATATQAQKQIAQALLNRLAVIHGNETAGAYRLEDAYDDATRAASDMANAFDREDWYGLTLGLVDAFKSLQLAFSKSGDAMTRMGAVAGPSQHGGPGDWWEDWKRHQWGGKRRNGRRTAWQLFRPDRSCGRRDCWRPLWRTLQHPWLEQGKAAPEGGERSCGHRQRPGYRPGAREPAGRA